MTVWINGKLSPSGEKLIDPRDRGFTLGDGLYETIRAAGGTLLRLDRHFARLGEGLRLLGFPLSVDEGLLSAAMQAVLEANALSDAVVRLTVSRGVGARGLPPDPAAKPTIVITAAPYVAPTPARMMIATVTRRNAQSPLSRVKTTSCADAILARIEAARLGYDDAILLNGAAAVAEATAANLFATIAGVLVTPPVADGALPGVMRGAIIDHRPVVERSLSAEDLRSAGEIFLTSSLGIRPVIALDGREMAVGKVSESLIALFGGATP